MVAATAAASDANSVAALMSDSAGGIAAPAIRPHVNRAEWVGNRRWNLGFKTDQVLALPEGKDQAAKALMTFAQLDGRNRLLGGKATAPHLGPIARGKCGAFTLGGHRGPPLYRLIKLACQG